MFTRAIFWCLAAAMLAPALSSRAAQSAGAAGQAPPAVHVLKPADYKVGPKEPVQTEVKELPEARQKTPAEDEQFQPPRQVLSVKTEKLEKAVAIELGWVDVKPDTQYRAQHLMQGVKLAADANVYLMIREHPERKAKPTQPYHKPAVSQRGLPADKQGQWLQRSETFTTGENTGALSIAIVLVKLEGEIWLGPLEVTDIQAQAQAQHGALMRDLHEQAATRQPLLPRTLVFSRSQMKYGLERNYYHIWSDRPLLVDRAFRHGPRKHVTPDASYQRVLQELVQYDMDGFAFFPETKDRMGMFELTDRAALPGVSLLPEFLPTFDIDAKMKVLEEALARKSTVRIGDRVLISSYVAQALSPEQWRQTLEALRAEYGDVFIFLPALTEPVALKRFYDAGQPLPREEVEKVKAHLRSYLDVCDGIYFNYAAALKKKDHTFDDGFYREIFIPVFKSVLAEPAYRQKYFGLSAYHSHHNPDLAIGLIEDHTRTLRRSFEAAMDAQPDVIILPEWDEQNENTSFRPTVQNSTTSQRILRYYMSRIRGKAPTAVVGDDAAVPNLILSTRKVLALGEPLVVELLNVPDGQDAGAYLAHLILLDETGKLVHAFEPVRFDAAELGEHRLTLLTEDFPHVRALVPVLNVNGYKGCNIAYDRGFHPVQVRATWNWDYKFVKQPLRELLLPQEVELAWDSSGPDADGALRIRGRIETPEELALVELLADDDEAYVLDPQDEFGLGDPERVFVMLEYRAARAGRLNGKITLTSARPRWHFNQSHLHQQAEQREATDTSVVVRSPVSPHVRWVGFSVPHADVLTAKLLVELDRAQFEVPLRDLLEKQMIAYTGDDGLHLALKRQTRPLDMPYHLVRKSAQFTARVHPWIGSEQYHLRLTSKSGKTWRSAPLLLPRSQGGASTTLRAWSETRNAPVDVQVAADRIPDLTYSFDPARGAVLLTPAGKPFWGSLGGFIDTTSGRGGNGGHSASVFGGDRQGYPANATLSAPRWVEEAGQPCLEFDGVGNFLQLPRESIPRHSSFTVSFEVKPEAQNKEQLLLAHRAYRPSSVELKLMKDGTLQASYFNHLTQRVELATGLALPVGQWSRVTLSYDFEQLRVQVNEQERAIPCQGPGLNLGAVIVGGYGETSKQFNQTTGNPGWFKGRLRGLRIVHNAAVEQ